MGDGSIRAGMRRGLAGSLGHVPTSVPSDPLERASASSHAVEVLEGELVEPFERHPPLGGLVGVEGLGPQRLDRLPRAARVGSDSWSTRASASACLTSGSARNARAFSRRIR